MDILKGSTNKSAKVRIINSSTGLPVTDTVHNTSGLVIWYRREGGTKQIVTLASLTALDSAHADGGFIHISDGYYRIDLPDAAFTTGAGDIFIGGSLTNAIIIGQEIQLVNYNPEDSVRLGLTALPNAAADSAGGLPVSDAGGLDLDAKLANTDQITSTRIGYLDASISSRSTLTAQQVWEYASRTLSSLGTLVADVATAVWGATTRTLSAFGFTVPRVTLVDTCTTNTDMRGTNGANTVTPPTVSEILAGQTEAGLTLAHAMQIITALALKASGGGTSSIVFRNYGDTKNRITMTVDENGNRSNVTVSFD